MQKNRLLQRRPANTYHLQPSSLHLAPGFTLVEMMVVVVIIGILATVFITQFSGQTDIAKIDATKANLTNIDNALELFKLNNGKYPDKLEDLVNRPPDVKVWPERGYLKVVPKDGWGKEFVYTPKGPDGYPEIVSLGADGNSGGDGINADLSSRDKDKEKK